MDIDYAINLLISAILGFMIGLQREIQIYYEKSQEFGGARTFAIISIIGFLSSYLNEYSTWVFPLVVIGTIFFITYVHIKTLKITGDLGTTTEFAAIATLLVGALLYFKDRQEAIFTAILILFLLELKSKIKAFEGKISKKDVTSAVLFALMTFVILPILPDRPIDPLGIVNPYQIWLMVVLISGLSFMGYVSVKTIGAKKGVLLTGFFGGLVSSTAVAITLSKKSLINKELIPFLAVAIGIASSTMFFRVVIEVAVVNSNILSYILYPYIFATIFGYIFLYFLYKNTKVKISKTVIEFKNPLELKEALKIGVLFGIVFGAISLVEKNFGDAGVFVVSAISGLTDVDAITLSLAKMSSNGGLSIKSASIGILIASISNSITKLIIVFYLGGKRIGLYISYFFLITLVPIFFAMYNFLM